MLKNPEPETQKPKHNFNLRREKEVSIFLKPFIMNAFRPCKFRKSKLGIFQCEKHFFEHGHPDNYKEVYQFCSGVIPEYFCSYADFGFNMEGQPTVFINCTHPFISRPMNSFEECKTCEYAPPQEDMQALGG